MKLTSSNRFNTSSTIHYGNGVLRRICGYPQTAYTFVVKDPLTRAFFLSSSLYLCASSYSHQRVAAPKREPVLTIDQLDKSREGAPVFLYQTQWFTPLYKRSLDGLVSSLVALIHVPSQTHLKRPSLTSYEHANAL